MNTLDVVTLPSGTSLRLEPTTVEAAPPCILYQGPWMLGLSALFTLKGRGRYIIDDIDNVGVERGLEADPSYRVIRKEILSKKGWTNCRPLTAHCPDGLFSPNLSQARFMGPEDSALLTAWAREQGMGGERFIRSRTLDFGIWALVGPDRAIAGVPMEAVRPALLEIISKHEEALRKSLADESAQRAAVTRLRHLMPDPSPFRTLIDYFIHCMERALGLFGGGRVESAAREFLDRDGGQLYQTFESRDARAMSVYNAGAALQGSRALGPDHWVPYYKVGLQDGARTPILEAVARSSDEMIAPKILVLEGAPHLAIPRAMANNRSIIAREHVYRELGTGSGHVFLDSNWVEALADCPERLHVHPLFQPLMDGHVTMPVGSFVQRLGEMELQVDSPGAAASPTSQWAGWVLRETLKEFRLYGYPLLCFAVGGERFLQRLELSSYCQFKEDAKAS